MLKVLDWCARTLFVAIAAMMIYRAWLFFAPRGADSFVRTDLIGADRSDALFTGFASIPLVEFRDQQGLVPFDQLQNKANAVRGFCYRVYDVAIGYPSLRAARESSEAASASAWNVVPPQVLAANTIEARHGGKMTQYECDVSNLVTAQQPRAAQLRKLQALLDRYGQWDSQVAHARQMLTSFSRRLQEARRMDLERKLQALQPNSTNADEINALRAEQAQASGTLGSVRLTLSAIAIFSQQKGWVFRSNEFYVRQDNADVTYGSDLLRDVATERPFFGSPTLRVKMPEPRLLAMDRYTTVLATNRKSFEVKDKEHDAQNRDPVEAAISDALARQLDRLAPQAIRVARDLLVSRIHELAPEDVGRIEVEFTGAATDADSAVLELLRRLSAEEGSDRVQ